MDAIFQLLSKNKQPAETSGETYLITGLGNPGREYRETRHNMGFMVVDRIAQRLGVSPNRLQSKALIAQGVYDGNRIILAKPQTYMNLSGQAISALLRFYKLPLDRFLVIHDDLDLPFGAIRMRPGGGAGGQKGLGSTIERLGTQEFPRLRVGIGRPPGNMDAADYVLHGFTAADRDVLDAILTRAADAALTFVKEGLQTAMNQYNGELFK